MYGKGGRLEKKNVREFGRGGGGIKDTDQQDKNEGRNLNHVRERLIY